MNPEPNRENTGGKSPDSANGPNGSSAAGGQAVEPLHRQLSKSLPRAVASSARKNHRLAEAMRPVVEKSIKISTDADSSVLVDALVRVIGPALRRSVVDGIGRLVLRLNRFLLVSISPRGIAWRIHALRAGRTFRDVVRERTHARRVKQVFLIHRRTGLLLELARRQDVTALDGDMVSAMLTAIQDFVHDSFSVKNGERLESIQVGGTTVWLEQGRLAVLAAIVDGDAPGELRQNFKDTLETVQSEFSQELAAFNGDASAFEPAKLYLEACVRTRLRDAGEKLLPVTWFVLTAPLLVLAVLGYFKLRESMTWKAYVFEIAEQPGIVVVDHGRRDGKFYITGLRDPMALDPVAMLTAIGFDERDVLSDWETYQALKPDLALARARQLLNPPETVTLRMEGDVLQAIGSAPRWWIEDASKLTKSLVGISQFETDRLTDSEITASATWDTYIGSLNSRPGIVVVSHGREFGRYHISGLRDPLADDPMILLKETGIEPSKVTAKWSPYRALDPPLVLARAIETLDPPGTVTLGLQDGVLVFKGKASHRWIVRATMLTRCMAGIGKIDTSDLLDDDMTRFTKAQAEVESMIFRYLDTGTDLWRGQSGKMNRLIALLSQVSSQARQMGLYYEIELRGHASDTRDADANMMASSAIARRFLEILQRQNVEIHRLTVYPAGSKIPDLPQGSKESVPKRCVSFKIVFFEN
jgi:hypothetical protein